MSQRDTGGNAFPVLEEYSKFNENHGQYEDYYAPHGGMTLRDYFAAKAPEASEDWLKMQMEQDRMANPHGDSYKPARRTVLQLRAEWRYAYADAMLKARQQ